MIGNPTIRRAVVAELLGSIPTSTTPNVVETFVGDQIRAMPAHLRWGVRVTETFLAATRRKPGATGAWDASRLAPVRSYAKLMRSLVLFAAYELP